jgi:hypothetical protein
MFVLIIKTDVDEQAQWDFDTKILINPLVHENERGYRRCRKVMRDIMFVIGKN